MLTTYSCFYPRNIKRSQLHTLSIIIGPGAVVSSENTILHKSIAKYTSLGILTNLSKKVVQQELEPKFVPINY